MKTTRYLAGVCGVLALVLTPLAAPPDASAARLWFTSGEQFRIVHRDHVSMPSMLTALLGGPSQAERRSHISTQIPHGTNLETARRVSRHTARVQLNRRFLAGIPARADQRNDHQRQSF